MLSHLVQAMSSWFLYSIPILVDFGIRWKYSNHDCPLDPSNSSKSLAYIHKYIWPWQFLCELSLKPWWTMEYSETRHLFLSWHDEPGWQNPCDAASMAWSACLGNQSIVSRLTKDIIHLLKLRSLHHPILFSRRFGNWLSLWESIISGRNCFGHNCL